MKLTTEQAHSMKLKNGVNLCTRCKAREPDLTKPCPKAKVWVEPAGTGEK